MRPGHFRPRCCPLIYHQKSGRKRGVTWWELFRKYAPVVSGPSVAPSYTTRKAKQMETASTYFFEKPPLTNRDISGWFSDWSAGIFQNSFHISQPTQPGTPGMKRGRHCEKYRPGFGTFCPKGIKSAPCLKMRNLYNFTNGYTESQIIPNTSKKASNSGIS